MSQSQIEILLPQPLRIEHQRRYESFNMPLHHYHAAYEIYYLVSGERFYFIKDKTYHVIQGDLILIDINDLHKTTEVGTPSHERILINFSVEYLQNLFPSPFREEILKCFHLGTNLFRWEIPIRHIIEDLLFKMTREAKNKAFGHSLYIQALFTELLVALKRQIDLAPPLALELRLSSYEKIYDILRFINQHFHEEISLPMLAASFYISPTHLSRTFKKVTGFSFTEYLNSVRAKEAQRMLAETDQSVTQIASKAGFDSLTHFGRVFKAITGLAPLKYRKQLKNISSAIPPDQSQSR